MGKITYRDPQSRGVCISVLLDGKVVGHIIREYSREDAKARWVYQPKSHGKRGELMDTLTAVKRSLEAD